MKGQFSTFFLERKSLLKKLHVSEQNLALHEAFLDYLWQKNQEDLNIVSRKMTPLELFEKHLLDSFFAFAYWPKKAKKIADLGSGGGFPAIPLAIENPEQTFYLYEKSPKKQKYLKNLAKHLNLKNVHIMTLVDDPIDMDIITARAFKPVSDILKMTRRHKQKGGVYFLYKGTKETLKEELKGINAELIALDTHGLAMERNLVKIN